MGVQKNGFWDKRDSDTGGSRYRRFKIPGIWDSRGLRYLGFKTAGAQDAGDLKYQWFGIPGVEDNRGSRCQGFKIPGVPDNRGSRYWTRVRRYQRFEIPGFEIMGVQNNRYPGLAITVLHCVYAVDKIIPWFTFLQTSLIYSSFIWTQHKGE